MDRDLRRFSVTDLPDHHDIRILPDQRTQPSRKGQPRALIHLDLRHTRQPVLHRILDRNDTHRLLIQELQRRIQRRRLSAARRPRREDQPLPLGKRPPKQRLLLPSHPQLILLDKIHPPRQDTDDDRLPIHRRQDRNAEIIRHPIDLLRPAPILRQTALPHIQPPKDLHTHRKIRCHGGRETKAIRKQPVLPKPHPHKGSPRLDMDITRPLSRRLSHDLLQHHIRSTAQFLHATASFLPSRIFPYYSINRKRPSNNVGNIASCRWRDWRLVARDWWLGIRSSIREYPLLKRQRCRRPVRPSAPQAPSSRAERNALCEKKTARTSGD